MKVHKKNVQQSQMIHSSPKNHEVVMRLQSTILAHEHMKSKQAWINDNMIFLEPQANNHMLNILLPESNNRLCERSHKRKSSISSPKRMARLHQILICSTTDNLEPQHDDHSNQSKKRSCKNMISMSRYHRQKE